MSQYFSQSFRSFGANINVKVDLSNYAPSVRFFSVAPEVVMEGLWILVTFPKIYLKIFSLKFFLVTMDCVAMATKYSEGSQDKKCIYLF